jgi:anti-sigma-K factor RskA
MNLSSPNDPELDALLGAYALDALDDEERARVDEYVARNDRARVEVDELLESAASLALAPVDDTTAPPELWERISASIDGDLALEVAADTDELARRRDSRASRRVRWVSLVAVAAAIVAAVLAVQVVSLHNRLPGAPGEKEAEQAFARASHVSGARTVALEPANGAEVARVVVLPDGTGYLKSDGLAPLDARHTYQLWAVTGKAADMVVISAGVLGSHPQAAAFRAPAQVDGFAITVERSPGVAQSSQPAFASASLS